MVHISNKFSLLLLPVTLFGYSIYSYSQTAPNLVLSSNPLYWQFQQYMWQLGYHQRPLNSLLFTLFVLVLFGIYGFLISEIAKKHISTSELVLIVLLSFLALIPSYPSLSNDIFNYMMNAKMMHVYHASPYTHAAWDFPNDPWLIFMMNIHTTTPYGIVWTGLGYLVYMVAFGDLQFAMLGFRLLAMLGILATGWSIWIITNKKLLPAAFFCLNPLVLIEAASNTHNDMTMMALFMIGVALFTLNREKHKMFAWIYLTIFWIGSAYTKLITVISPAVYLSYLPCKKLKSLSMNFFDLLAIAMVVVMYADGAKRYFSWYLLWALPVAVLAQSKFVQVLIITLSFGGLLSYLPYLYTGDYTPFTGNVRIGIYFIPALIYSIIFLMTRAWTFVFTQKQRKV
jgi:hypothetical protein